MLIQLIERENPAVIAGLLFSVLPWFLIMRLIRRLATAQPRAARSRARAHAQAAALGRARPRRARAARRARALAVRARAAARGHAAAGPRPRRRPRGGRRPGARAPSGGRAGSTEARQAISALRGDDLPALEDLAGTFPNATFTVTGTPREPSSEAQLALYRTAQEALTNVRRHSASDRVELKLVYEDDGTTLTVQDHGAAAPVIGGRGYGLTGMRERAELLGGRLNAGPTDDGFRVELWLPRVIRVLLADDQRVVREGLGMLVGLLDGIELVATAADGEEALALAAEHNPDVVLMDLRMPRMDGIEAIRRLAARGTSAIALTTYADDASVLGALRAGARGYLTKDAGAEEIRAAVEAVARGEAALDPAIQHHVARRGQRARRAVGAGDARTTSHRARSRSCS